MSSLPGVFRRRNMGTHPNTHCRHAALDVLFICWIPAQSRSLALPRALSLPPSRPPPFLLPVIGCHTWDTLQSLLGSCRLLGSEPHSPCHLFWSQGVFPFLFLHAFPPVCLSSFHPRLLFHHPSLFPSGVLLPYSLFPCPHLCLSLSLSLSCLPQLTRFVPGCPRPVFAQQGSPEITTLDLAPRLRAQGASSPRGKPGVAYSARAHILKARSDAAALSLP